jgi:hypothetical protein
MRRAAVAAAILALAGCGGSSAAPHAGRTVTVGTYAGFPATTIVGTYTAQGCAQDAAAIAHDALLYYEHTAGGAPPPADLYYIDMRADDAHFRADACPPSDLGLALRHALTARQRGYLLGNLSSDLVQAFRTALNPS